MEKGNVLVIGNSGVGKSTLINAVLGEDVAKTGWGIEGTTKELQIYENDDLPFRVIDSAGFEPSFFKELSAVKAVKKWSKESAKTEGRGKQINIIWFCVDGTSRKLFEKTITTLSRATKMWESVPIITVITKSYSVVERDENISMVHTAFAKQKISKNLKKVIPVVAATYRLNDTAFAPPEGITDLINTTNELMPEGIEMAKKDLFKYNLSRKEVLAHSLIGVVTTSGVVVGAVPIPVADATILNTLEAGLVNGIARIYDIGKNEKSSQFINSIIEVGTVSATAKTVISGLKEVPGMNIPAIVLNAIVAGVFVALIGEGSNFLFEQVYKGEKTLDDIEWAKKIMESKLTSEFIDKVSKAVKILGNKKDKDSIAKAVNTQFERK